MKKAYSVISKIYDISMTDFDYRKYYEFIKRYVSGKVVELACGSGAFTQFLVEQSDNLIAVDLSQEMLEKALENNFKNRQYIQFVQENMLDFQPISKVNTVVSVCDGFNYLSGQDLAKAFNKISGYIKKNGYFIFDISSEYKLTKVIANNLFYEDNDDFTYLWCNKLCDDKINMEITLFEKSGDVYLRQDEEQTQFVHNTQMVIDLLNQNGFEVNVFDGEKFCNLQEDSLRVLFVCKKIN